MRSQIDRNKYTGGCEDCEDCEDGRLQAKDLKRCYCAFFVDGNSDIVAFFVDMFWVFPVNWWGR